MEAFWTDAAFNHMQIIGDIERRILSTPIPFATGDANDRILDYLLTRLLTAEELMSNILARVEHYSGNEAGLHTGLTAFYAPPLPQ